MIRKRLDELKEYYLTCFVCLIWVSVGDFESGNYRSVGTRCGIVHVEIPVGFVLWVKSEPKEPLFITFVIDLTLNVQKGSFFHDSFFIFEYRDHSPLLYDKKPIAVVTCILEIHGSEKESCGNASESRRSAGTSGCEDSVCAQATEMATKKIEAIQVNKKDFMTVIVLNSRIVLKKKFGRSTTITQAAVENRYY